MLGKGKISVPAKNLQLNTEKQNQGENQKKYCLCDATIVACAGSLNFTPQRCSVRVSKTRSHIVALRSFIVASSCKGISYEYQDSGDVRWMADWSVIHVKSYGPQGVCPFTENINVWFTKVQSLYHCVSGQDLIYF